MRFTNVPTLVKALNLMIRKTALLTCLTAATLTFSMIDAACAAPPAVVAVNREIGLSVTGNFQDVIAKGNRQYNSTYQGYHYTDTYQTNSSYRDHVTGWTPGFRADAQYMFDTSILKHLYVASSFTLDSGNINENYHYLATAIRSGASPNRYGGRDNVGFNRSGINVTGEIGKGFLLLNDRLLITPVVQGGYSAGGYDTYTAYGKGYVGLALHVDYAITSRLVIRGRAGWAQYLKVGTHYNSNGYYSDKGSRPEWSGDIALDYRMTDCFHLTGGVRYTYLNYGHANYFNSTSSSYGSAYSYSNDETAWRNGVQLRLGVAYQL
ncbi:hypothetical protein LWC05_13570 [Acetobacter sicerae]|uniref:Outer membrane protein beta-barrel domain-containing protein n=1 Tax=Acetobacter sicerae TaxID=85325 RepID=A0ABS8VV91_9PROT|nr:hypothetical protein [Acetobacter sicerae]MCE0744908.1 hypothetical protein [Acetobacter sicerae]